MERKQLVREAKRAALTRMEDSARTEKDFQEVIAQWDKQDRNRERRERLHEIGRPSAEMLHWDRANENDEKGKLKGRLGMVFPIPFAHPSWRKTLGGDFIDMIYDNADEIWQLVEDKDVSKSLKALTGKQKTVFFLSSVRYCTPQQIACYQGKTDRAVRKLLAAAVARIHKELGAIDKRKNK